MARQVHSRRVDALRHVSLHTAGVLAVGKLDLVPFGDAELLGDARVDPHALEPVLLGDVHELGDVRGLRMRVNSLLAADESERLAFIDRDHGFFPFRNLRQPGIVARIA